ncbi:hypothetical protein OH76DRAFT_1491117 [Lentinus brumalis]|uniref:Uncharacterized protein n=1 Tax=Lentinus brumalis TaxID=2498619 RepID=A0A371CGR9_9APHY|nr:hypothetical protein OH76DRAFT_1491117 [Polyporus brumalis]
MATGWRRDGEGGRWMSEDGYQGHHGESKAHERYEPLLVSSAHHHLADLPQQPPRYFNHDLGSRLEDARDVSRRKGRLVHPELSKDPKADGAVSRSVTPIPSRSITPTPPDAAEHDFHSGTLTIPIFSGHPALGSTRNLLTYSWRSMYTGVELYDVSHTLDIFVFASACLRTAQSLKGQEDMGDDILMARAALPPVVDRRRPCE